KIASSLPTTCATGARCRHVRGSGSGYWSCSTSSGRSSRPPRGRHVSARGPAGGLAGSRAGRARRADRRSASEASEAPRHPSASRDCGMVCGPPPAGYARWTVRVTTETKRQGIVADVGRETIRQVLAHHELKPWRKKMWCVPQLDAEYIDSM